MRKLMSKKGFTLVELMIVVVILGILVAIAVPIFGAVTKNAKKKSCLSNQRVIKGNMETFQMTGNDGDQLSIGKGSTVNCANDSTFLALFDGGELPKCPDGDTAYTCNIVSDANGVISYTVACNNNSEHTA